MLATIRGVLVPGAAGMRTVLMERWDPERALALIEQERVSPADLEATIDKTIRHIEILREARQFNPKEFRVVAAPQVVELFLDEESQHLAGLSDFLKTHADKVYPVTREILERGARYSAVDVFRAQEALH